LNVTGVVAVGLGSSSIAQPLNITAMARNVTVLIMFFMAKSLSFECASVFSEVAEAAWPSFCKSEQRNEFRPIHPKQSAIQKLRLTSIARNFPKPLLFPFEFAKGLSLSRRVEPRITPMSRMDS
jgi:hypothetical protein